MAVAKPCPHGDPYCPCQDGGACHYVDVVDGAGHVVSPADLCTNAACAACGRVAS